MMVLVIVILAVAALIVTSNIDSVTTTEENQTVFGLVTEINQEENYFILENIETLSVADDGSAEIRETEYLVSWTGDKAIQQYHPSVLNGGEMVQVTLRETLAEGDVNIVDPASIEVTLGTGEGGGEAQPAPPEEFESEADDTNTE